ncbi:MAG: hypothetical protein L0332_00435 [Chloroflexi bacterium]|nr:hypothetical protein [Chloroflexota bacterium]MCI0575981.1 hypothetical protein [Chloroflexota bacterium]MCI0648237.1 hypothetical protein [Chloroflexota bacterium]MCI0725191.1 hypothetical protein [Chloroflexota bacterium]
MKLIALRCPVCTQPLAPENDDIVVACGHCRAEVAIGQDGPSQINVRYALPAGARPEMNPWYPFWVFSGQVQLQHRETQGGGRSGQKEAEALWSAPRRLYVPAWELSMHTAQDVGSRLIQQQPQFQLVERPEQAQLVSAVVTPGDARKLLEFIVLAVEARRSDWLKDLVFHLALGEPELWAIPVKSNER